MKNKLMLATASLVLLIGYINTASAMLIDRGNGMIYDSDQDLTWLQDANYAQTSGYDTDGRMNWNAATTWADNLTYGGYTDWRLASVIDNGNDGCNFSYNGTDCGYNVDTSGSELSYMWYDILGNTPYADTSGNGSQSGWGLSSTTADGVSILNLQSPNYWLGTEYTLSINHAWNFNSSYGIQGPGIKANELYAWAVRSGDVAAATVPEPSTMLLLGAGLIGVVGVKWRHC